MSEEYNGTVVSDINAPTATARELLPSECPKCGKQMNSPHGVAIHMRRMHGVIGVTRVSRQPDEQACPECGKKCANKLGLGMHLSRSHGIISTERAKWRRAHGITAGGNKVVRVLSDAAHRADGVVQAHPPEPDIINHCPGCGLTLKPFLMAAKFLAKQNQ